MSKINPMQKIPLIHPIYLDIPMLVSFAAALQDGSTLETEVTADKKTGNATTAKVAAKFSPSQLFKALVDSSASIDLEGDRSSEFHEVRKESKAYTEASIAIILYHQLQQAGGYIVKPKNLKDLASYSPGTLVEVAGTVEKNAVDAVIDYLDAADILSQMITPEPQSPNRGRSGNQKPNPPSEIARIRGALDQDRKRTPISNVVVRCSEPNNLNVVVTLRTENLRDLTLSELHRNNVRIVGKITRSVP
jgi:hypothetical protein